MTERFTGCQRPCQDWGGEGSGGLSGTCHAPPPTPPLLSETSSVGEMLPRRVGDLLFALELLPRGPRLLSRTGLLREGSKYNPSKESSSQKKKRNDEGFHCLRWQQRNEKKNVASDKMGQTAFLDWLGFITREDVGNGRQQLFHLQNQPLLEMELTSHIYIKIMSRVAFLRIIIGKHRLFFFFFLWRYGGVMDPGQETMSEYRCVCVVTGAVLCFCFGSQVGPMRGCEHNGPPLLLRGCSHWELLSGQLHNPLQ